MYFRRSELHHQLGLHVALVRYVALLLAIHCTTLSTDTFIVGHDSVHPPFMCSFPTYPLGPPTYMTYSVSVCSLPPEKSTSKSSWVRDWLPVTSQQPGSHWHLHGHTVHDPHNPAAILIVLCESSNIEPPYDHSTYTTAMQRDHAIFYHSLSIPTALLLLTPFTLSKSRKSISSVLHEKPILPPSVHTYQ